MNKGDDFEKMLIDFLERYLAQKLILRKTITEEGLDSYSIGYYSTNGAWDVLNYEGNLVSNYTKEECEIILKDLESLK